MANTDPERKLIDEVIGRVRGNDGVSPTITVADIEGGHRVTIVDADHPTGQSFDVMNGDKGDKGDTGDDGVSPTITITNITGGHRVTMTDAEHPLGQSFDVMDGEVDSTLSIAGKAADAKAAGDAVDNLKSALTSGTQADAIYHLGFYLDANGDLCQKED